MLPSAANPSVTKVQCCVIPEASHGIQSQSAGWPQVGLCEEVDVFTDSDVRICWLVVEEPPCEVASKTEESLSKTSRGASGRMSSAQWLGGLLNRHQHPL